jgi:hypothetical protein
MGFLSHEAGGMRAALGAASCVLAIAAVAGLIPMAALMVSLAYATRDGRGIGAARTLAAAVRAFRPLAVLLALMVLLQGLVLGLAVLLAVGTEAWTHGLLGEARAQETAIVLFAILGLGVAALAVVHDLARAAVVRRGLGAMHALFVGAEAFRRAPAPIAWSWAWRSALSLGIVAAVALVADRLGGQGGIALVGLALLHQGVALSRVALRGSWLARALRSVYLPASER